MFPISMLGAVGFLKTHWKPFAAIGLVLLVLLLTYCAGANNERISQQTQTIKTERKIGKADATAADTRVGDTVRTKQQELELDAAFKAVGGPDARRALRGCVILRQQGHDTSRVPACSAAQ